jgi:hypothetical protein
MRNAPHLNPFTPSTNSSDPNTTNYLDFATTQYAIITLLKKHRSGLTISELESQLQCKINNELFQILLNNEHLIYNPNQNKFTFKFKYNIFSKEDLIQYLQHSSNVLIVDDDVRIGYPDIIQDIQVCVHLCVTL